MVLKLSMLRTFLLRALWANVTSEEDYKPTAGGITATGGGPVWNGQAAVVERLLTTSIAIIGNRKLANQIDASSSSSSSTQHPSSRLTEAFARSMPQGDSS